ncbi:MAG: hypothetical protein V9G23_02980 [Giesbergeria sp.]
MTPALFLWRATFINCLWRTGVLDSLVMVRVMHHLADVPAALVQLRRDHAQQQHGVLEYANKRNLKALVRWAARKQAVVAAERGAGGVCEAQLRLSSGMDGAAAARGGTAGAPPVCGVALPAPAAIKQRVRRATAGAVSTQRSSMWAVAIRWRRVSLCSSSHRQSAPAAAAGTAPEEVAQLFVCPECSHEGMERVAADQVRCRACGASYARQQQIWDFKDRLE